MKTLLRVSLMVLVACSLQNCEDLAFQSVESNINARAKASKQIKSPKQKHAFTISAITNDDNFPLNHFMVSIKGSGSIRVNWGDGTAATYALDQEYGVELEKNYESAGRYHISITGDLKNITAFKSSYGQGLFDDINLRPLTGLKSLRISSVSGPEVIDVTHSTNLEDLSLYDIRELREIRLPQQHSLWAVSIAANTSLTTSTVDALINSIYQTAIKKQIWGFLHVNKCYEDDCTEMVGPPSPKSIAQLIELQNSYNWEILPAMPAAVNY